MEEKVEESVNECLDAINPEFVIGDNNVTQSVAEQPIDCSKFVKYKIIINGYPTLRTLCGYNKLDCN